MTLQELTKAKDKGKRIAIVFGNDQELAKSVLKKIERIWPKVRWNGRGELTPIVYMYKGLLIENNVLWYNSISFDITLTAQEFLAMTNIPENTQWISEPFKHEGRWWREVKPVLGWWYKGDFICTDWKCGLFENKYFCKCTNKVVVSGETMFFTETSWNRVAIPHPAPEMTEKQKQIKLINDKIAELQAEAKKLEGME